MIQCDCMAGRKDHLLIHSAAPQSRQEGSLVLHMLSVPTFEILAKQNKVKTMFATGETVGLAEWIIDDTCLVLLYDF